MNADRIENTSTDRIEKKVILLAPRSRVWRAISDANEFGAWFGMKFDGSFEPGARIRGRSTEPGYEHVAGDILIERIEPERLFFYRWHPYAIDPAMDYSGEPMTLVEFRLEEVAGGTELTVTESGFDRIPAARRAEAFRMNDQGWAEQVRRIERHVTS
jgi:uncharacterized protein YndB with AHSA1/START domain